MILACDPGAHSVAWAAIDFGGRVQACGMWRDPTDRAPIPIGAKLPASWTHIVVELPRIYRQSKSKGDPNDLISVAVTVGRIVEWAAEYAGASVRLVRPREWKGNVPKEIMTRRIWRGLDAMERDRLDDCGVPESLRHNVLDAIGLGLWAYGGRPDRRGT